jgi:hypothetical protein
MFSISDVKLFLVLDILCFEMHCAAGIAVFLLWVFAGKFWGGALALFCSIFYAFPSFSESVGCNLFGIKWY